MREIRQRRRLLLFNHSNCVALHSPPERHYKNSPLLYVKNLMILNDIPATGKTGVIQMNAFEIYGEAHTADDPIDHPTVGREVSIEFYKFIE